MTSTTLLRAFGLIDRATFSNIEVEASLEVDDESGEVFWTWLPDVTGGIDPPGADNQPQDFYFEGDSIDVGTVGLPDSVGRYLDLVAGGNPLPRIPPGVEIFPADGLAIDPPGTLNNVTIADEDTERITVSQRPVIPVFNIPDTAPRLPGVAGGGLQEIYDGLPTSKSEYFNQLGKSTSINVPTMYSDYESAPDIFTGLTRAEFDFGSVNLLDLFAIEEIDLPGPDDVETPPLLVPTADSPPSISVADDEIGATLTKELRNEGDSPANATVEIDVSSAWSVGSETVTASVGPVDPGETADAVVEIGEPALGELSFTEAAAAINDGETSASFEYEFTGDVPDASWTSGSVDSDFTDALESGRPDEPAEAVLNIANIIPSQLSLSDVGEIPNPFEVVIENNGDADAENVSVSGFGDSQTVTVPRRGSETIELTPTPSILPSPGGSTVQDVTVDFGGATVASESAEIVQSAPDGPSFDFVSVPDIGNISPEETLGSREFQITNTGDRGTAVDIVINDNVTVGVGTVAAGSTAPPVEANLDAVSLPTPGSRSELRVEVVDQASGEVYETTTIPLRVGVSTPGDVLQPGGLGLPQTVISGDEGELQWVGVDEEAGALEFQIPEPSAANAGAAITGGNSRYETASWGELNSNSSWGETFTYQADAGDELVLRIQYGRTSQFTIPPSNSSQGSWTVPPIVGVTVEPPEFTIEDFTESVDLGFDDPLSLSPTIANTGGVAGDVTVEFAGVSKTVTIPAGGESQPTLSPDPPEPGSDADFTLTVGDQTRTVTVSRPPPPPASFAIADVSLGDVGSGVLPVNVTVENTGEVPGEKDVAVGGASQTLSIPPGESEELTLTPSIPSLDSDSFTVSTPDDQQSVDAPTPSSFEIADVSLGDVGGGGLPVNVTVENVGGLPGEKTVSAGDETQTVSVLPGASEELTLTPSISSIGGNTTFTVSTPDGQQNVSTPNFSPAEFELSVPSSLTMDTPGVVELEATVENVGDEFGTTEVSMIDDSEVVELGGGESATVPLRTNITPSVGSATDYTVRLSDGTSETVNVDFPSDLVDTALPTATVDVRNSGDETGSMSLLVEGNLIDSREIDPGETATFTFEPPLPEPGTSSQYEVEVRPDGDGAGDSRTFTMSADPLPEPDPAAFRLVDVVGPDSIPLNESVTLDAVIENTGGESGSVTVSAGNDIRRVTIGGGEQQIVTLSPGIPRFPGSESYTVEAAGDTRNFSVDVREPPELDPPELPERPELPDRPEPPGVTPQPPQPPELPGGEEQPYDGPLTYFDPFGLFGTSEQLPGLRDLFR